MKLSVRVRGGGRVQLPAYGLADAEHQVEKEIARAWPDARVEIAEVGRAAHAGNIVEEFAVTYRIHGTLQVPAESPEQARTLALRRLRECFNPTRFQRVEWEQVVVAA